MWVHKLQERTVTALVLPVVLLQQTWLGLAWHVTQALPVGFIFLKLTTSCNSGLSYGLGLMVHPGELKQETEFSSHTRLTLGLAQHSSEITRQDRSGCNLFFRNPCVLAKPFFTLSVTCEPYYCLTNVGAWLRYFELWQNAKGPWLNIRHRHLKLCMKVDFFCSVFLFLNYI